jgi:hypothetical protein
MWVKHEACNSIPRIAPLGNRSKAR